MSRRVRAEGQASIQARYRITRGCDTDKSIIVAAIFEADNGHLESREFQQHKAARPESRMIASLLQDFPAIWSQMTSGEQRVLLRVLFVAIYFDEKAIPRQVLVNSPFDRLLHIDDRFKDR